MRIYIVPSTADLPISLFISPLLLSLSVCIPTSPTFRIELFGRAPSPSSPTRRLNPDRLDHKADQFVAACFVRSPQPPTSSTALRHPIAAATLPRQTPARINPADESHLATPRTLPQVPHPRSIIRTTAPTAPTGTRPPTAPFPPRSLARDSKGPLPRPVCRQSGSLPRTASRLCFGPGLDCHINPAGALVPALIQNIVDSDSSPSSTANSQRYRDWSCAVSLFRLFLLFRSRPIHHAAAALSTSAGSDF